MPQFGEDVKVGTIDVDDVPCPFDHDPGEPPEVENHLIGVGGTLRDKMEGREGTHLYAKAKPPEPPEKNPDPRHRMPPLLCIDINLRVVPGQEQPVKGHTYHLTCAAHHCIPAQASLKNHDLLQYMCSKNAGSPLKGGSTYKGKVWANVGYDVNGSQNGIFLPGNYAVTGNTGAGWTSDMDADDEVPAPGSPTFVVMSLKGENGVISYDNRKWMYVSKAVHKVPGQFHDSHPDYSNFVKGVLTKIWEDYEKLYKDDPDVNVNCDKNKCQELRQKIKDKGKPTPFGLVDRLNKVSDKLKNYLNGTSWSITLYTSNWGKAYIEAMRVGNPAVNAGTM
jgi:hypothetical protein